MAPRSADRLQVQERHAGLTHEEMKAQDQQERRAKIEGKMITDAFCCAKIRRVGLPLKYDGVLYRVGAVMPTFGNHRNDDKLIRMGFVKRVKPDEFGIGDILAQRARQDAEEMDEFEGQP